jgi:hypothetical protein
MSIEGEVVESGCDSTFVPAALRSRVAPAVDQPFRKGATFRVAYSCKRIS